MSRYRRERQRIMANETLPHGQVMAKVSLTLFEDGFLYVERTTENSSEVLALLNAGLDAVKGSAIGELMAPKIKEAKGTLLAKLRERGGNGS